MIHNQSSYKNNCRWLIQVVAGLFIMIFISNMVFPDRVNMTNTGVVEHAETGEEQNQKETEHPKEFDTDYCHSYLGVRICSVGEALVCFASQSSWQTLFMDIFTPPPELVVYTS
jgi:hypothetical protein